MSSMKLSGLNFFTVLILVLLAGASLYLPAVARNIGWYNSSEFAIAAITLDVPHAPGYPLFTRLGNLAVKYLPGNSPAEKLNLMTAIIGILGAMMLSTLLLFYGLSALAAALGGILLLTCVTYRDQSLMAEVYNLEICLIIAGLMAGLLIENGKLSIATGFFAGVAGALGVGHRPTFGLYALTLLLFVRAGNQKQALKPATGFWIAMLAGVAAGLIPSLDLYFRLQNPARVLLDPMTGQGIDGFFGVFTGTVYSGGFFVFSPAEVLVRFLAFLRLTAIENGIWLLLGPACLLLLKKKPQGPLPQAMLAILFINLGFVLNYNAFEAHTMLLPSFMALAALASIAADQIRRPGLKILGCLAIASTAAFGLTLHPADLESPEPFVKRSLERVPGKAMVLMSNDVEFRPYWFMRIQAGFRNDLAIQLVDKFESPELQVLKPVIDAGKLYGSLVYPLDSRQQLTASYSIAAEGYLHKILPAQTWQELTPGQEPEPMSALSVDHVQSSWPAGTGNGGDQPKAGGVFNYAYTFTGAPGSLEKLAIVTLLLDDGGMTLSRHGMLVGHDLHFPGEFICRSGRPELAAYKSSRALVLPYDLKPGRYRIVMLGFLAKDTWPASWLEALPEGVSTFNIDGFLEVFAIKYGLACRPLVKSLPLNSFLTEPSFFPLQKTAVELASFTIQPGSGH